MGVVYHIHHHFRSAWKWHSLSQYASNGTREIVMALVIVTYTNVHSVVARIWLSLQACYFSM